MRPEHGLCDDPAAERGDAHELGCDLDRVVRCAAPGEAGGRDFAPMLGSFCEPRCWETGAMPEAYIVEAVRTPVGKRGGGMSKLHPADLGALPIAALIERSGIDPGAVDDVVYGNVNSVGPQGGDIARTAWLAAGMPMHVPGVTVDRQCGSAQQAVHFAAQAVMSGTMDLAWLQTHHRTLPIHTSNPAAATSPASVGTRRRDARYSARYLPGYGRTQFVRLT